MALASKDQQRILRWLIAKLRHPGGGEARMAVAV
jgi:hypothetical protein